MVHWQSCTLQFWVVLAFGQTIQCTTRNWKVQWSRPLVLALGIPLRWGVEFLGPVHRPTLMKMVAQTPFLCIPSQIHSHATWIGCGLLWMTVNWRWLHICAVMTKANVIRWRESVSTKTRLPRRHNRRCSSWRRLCVLVLFVAPVFWWPTKLVFQRTNTGNHYRSVCAFVGDRSRELTIVSCRHNFGEPSISKKTNFT